MTKTIAIADLNLGIIPQAVRDDALWLRCMALACRSRSEKQRYGAIVILNGQVVGEGWNRLLQKGEPFPFRTTFFLHAERAAIGQAIQHLGSLESIHGASVLVAGFLVPERRPLVRRDSAINLGSCAQCAALYVKHHLSVTLMSQNGWVKLEGEVALENAQLTARFLKENGISKHDHRRTISL